LVFAYDTASSTTWLDTSVHINKKPLDWIRNFKQNQQQIITNSLDISAPFAQSRFANVVIFMQSDSLINTAALA
jgi:hypothetical protein